ncbi:hypothetical protein [Campylobacter upsaliensis]|nr:hypothetical protein [Campylobacter upsaliensis]
MQIFHHAKYTLINIRHDLNCKEMKKVELEWGEKLHFIEYLFNDTHKKGEAYKRAWLGNTKLWHKIMRSLSLEKRS